MLRLQNYVTFRCIALIELLFMKAKLAASDPQFQVVLMKRLLDSERIVVSALSFFDCMPLVPPLTERIRWTFTNVTIYAT